MRVSLEKIVRSKTMQEAVDKVVGILGETSVVACVNQAASCPGRPFHLSISASASCDALPAQGHLPAPVLH